MPACLDHSKPGAHIELRFVVLDEVLVESEELGGARFLRVVLEKPSEESQGVIQGEVS